MPRLADTTRLGATHLTVSDLDRSLAFYQDALGLRVHRHADGEAALGSGGDDVLVLVEQPGARPAGRHAGLYHVALLYPSRLELAYALDRIVRTQTPIEGCPTTAPTRRSTCPTRTATGSSWPPTGRARSGRTCSATAPGRGRSTRRTCTALADAPAPARGAPGLAVGHLHLHVGDVDAARAFYRDVIGFDVTMEMPTAVFLSAGGYHHHVAANVWRGRGVPPAPADAVGLRHWTVLVDGDLRSRARRGLPSPTRSATAGCSYATRPGMRSC